MKKQLLSLIALALMCFSSKAQMITVDFEDVNFAADSFYQDSSSADLISGGITFDYVWTSTQWGDYWSGGFSASTMTDSVTSGSGNMYSARMASGFYQSPTYAVGQTGGIINTMPNGAASLLNGIYVSNSTYAYNSMRDGDMFAKKFGGTSGDDPDWLKLVIRRYSGGMLMNDSIEFYLADFRFTNNTQDYILKEWTYIDLTVFTGLADSLQFDMSSSDAGAWGMNTPGFFCIDNFSLTPGTLGVKENQAAVKAELFPNPANDVLMIKGLNESDYRITDAQGRQVQAGTNNEMNRISIKDLQEGFYMIEFIHNHTKQSVSFIKAN